MFKLCLLKFCIYSDKYRTKVKRLLILFSYQFFPILDRISLKIIHASILRKDFTVIFIGDIIWFSIGGQASHFTFLIHAHFLYSANGELTVRARFLSFIYTKSSYKWNSFLSIRNSCYACNLTYQKIIDKTDDNMLLFSLIR